MQIDTYRLSRQNKLEDRAINRLSTVYLPYINRVSTVFSPKHTGIRREKTTKIADKKQKAENARKIDFV